MNAESAKHMMDAFYEAKRIRDQMPPLPEGVNPSYINTLDAIVQLGEGGQKVRISDVARLRHLPRPGVTRTIGEMTAKGLVNKIPDEMDHRVIHLCLTSRGEELYETYVQDYFGSLTRKLTSITDQEVETMVRTIHAIDEALQ